MKIVLRFLVLVSAIVLAACDAAPTSDLTTIKSTLPSASANAMNVANLYRAAKAAGAPEFASPVSAEEIVDALEEGVSGGGLYSDSQFQISPIKSAERDQVIELVRQKLGL